MSVFLLLVGLTLFISGAAMYFAHAYRNDPRWILSSVLFPVVVPLYYRRHWDDLQIAGFVQSTGLAMAVAGGLMLAFQQDHPEGLVTQEGVALVGGASSADSGFVDSERALRLMVQHGPGTPLSGRLNGRPFTPERVELIDGSLRLILGRPYWPEREIAVTFPAGSLDISKGIKRAIGPDTPGAPELRLTWQEDGRPVSTIYHEGYRLEFEVVPVADNKLAGYIQLVLPDARESFVGGDVTVVTNHLRYVHGVVDLRFDHEDTLKHVAGLYARAQYAAPDIDTVSFADVQMDALGGTARLLATVRIRDGREGRHVVLLSKGDSGWFVQGPQSTAATEAAGYKPVYSLVVPATDTAPRVTEERTRAAPAAKAATVRTLAFAELASLDGQGAVVEYRSGRSEQGVLRGLRKDRLVVEAIKGGGKVEYLLSAAELSQLRMNSGDIIRLAPVAAAEGEQAAEATAPAAPVVAAPPRPAAPAAPEPLMVGERDLSAYLNRRVTVVANTGKSTTGVLRGLNKNGLVIETQVGAGKLDYIVPVDHFESIDYAPAP